MGGFKTLAQHLSPGTVFDGQRGIKEMDEAAVLAACRAFVQRAPAMVLEAWRSLREGKVLSAEDANSKFATTEGAFAGQFADPGFGGYVRTPERIEVDAGGDRAAEHGRWTASWKDAPPQSGPYLAVWRKVTGQWMIESETFVTTG
jgi:hypothetical protein